MQVSIVFLVRVQCRRKESSRSLSHLLMSFLFDKVLLANVSVIVRVRHVIVGPSVVCRLSVTFVHHTQAIEIFSNISTPFGTVVIW